MTRVAIVGGGISGLALAEALARRAPTVEVVVLEAARQPGGKITTRNDAGFVIETGPHGFLDKEPKAMALVERLGLGERLIPAAPRAEDRYIVRGGRLRKLPAKPPAFLGSDILPLGAKARVLMEPLIGRRRDPAEESVWSFARRRLGPGAADVLVDAFVTGIYGGDPKALSLRAAFPRLFELEQTYGSLIKAQIQLKKSNPGPGGVLHSFRSGLGELIAALASRARLRLGHAVERLIRTAGGYRVEGTGAPVEVDAVVLTAPLPDMVPLLAPFGEAEAARLREVPYAPVAVVVQGFERAAIPPTYDGFGFLCPHAEGLEVLGSIWASTVFEGHAPDGTWMMRTLLGGARRPAAAEGTDAEIAARARAALSRLVGLAPDARPVVEHVVRWPAGIPQYNLGHAERIAAADALEARHPGLFFGGNAFRGVAMIQCVADADRLGERVAAWCDMRANVV